MIREEVAAVLLRLTEAFRCEMTELEVNVWAEELLGLDYDLARDAAQRIICTTPDYFPRLAGFLDAYQAERRASLARTPALGNPLPPPHSAGNFHDELARARASLRKETADVE